ncbi:MAG: hypothetical protein JNL34_13925 [Anaerolineae bacterium]|nr:hypothetical protein [Anaerolineae bacterium]
MYADGGAAYELGFFALDGRTRDVITVEARQVRAVRRGGVLHVRELSARR